MNVFHALITSVVISTSLFPQFSWSEERDGGSCIPPVANLKIDSRAFHCKKNSDCLLVKEACRSCQPPMAINKNYLKTFTEVDQKARSDSQCVISCEACDQSQYDVLCQAGKCAVKTKR